MRGPPGSGKMMLSQALFESFHGKRIYVSLRVTWHSILDPIPWLERIPPGEIMVIDAAAEMEHVKAHVGSRVSAKQLLSEKLTEEQAECLWLPGAVQSAPSAADPKTSTLIVLDSWDALVDQYLEGVPAAGSPKPSRSEIERKLVSRMARGNVMLVLVLERDISSVLDYPVDGIVETSRLPEEDRLERWLSLPKLRRVPIGTDTYPFTFCSHAKFAAITPTLPGDRHRLEPPAPDPHSEATGLRPGSTDYAAAFVRLRYGVNDADGAGVPRPAGVTSRAARPNAHPRPPRGGRALIIAPPSADPADASLTLGEQVRPEDLRDRLHVLTTIPPLLTTPGLAEVFVPFHRIGWTKNGPSTPLPDDAPFLHRGQVTETPNLIVADLPGLEALADGAGVARGRGVLASLAAAVFPRSSVHVVTVGRTGDPRFELLSALSEIHLPIRFPHGRVFVNVYRPYLDPRARSQEQAVESSNQTPIL
jgi:hypothetical protein